MAKRMTLENLAIMIQKGFLEMNEKMAKQSDLIALTERLDRFEKYVEMRLDAIDTELRAIRANIQYLMKTQAGTEVDIRKLEKRVTRLERKAGVKSIA